MTELHLHKLPPYAIFIPLLIALTFSIIVALHLSNEPTKVQFSECLAMAALATGHSVAELEGFKGEITVEGCQALINTASDCRKPINKR